MKFLPRNNNLSQGSEVIAMEQSLMIKRIKYKTGVWRRKDRKKKEKTQRIAREIKQEINLRKKKGYLKKYKRLITSDIIKLEKDED